MHTRNVQIILKYIALFLQTIRANNFTRGPRPFGAGCRRERRRSCGRIAVSVIVQVRAVPTMFGVQPCVQRELHAGVRSAGDVSSEEARPAASGRLRVRDRRTSAPPRRSSAPKKSLRADRGDVSRVCVVDFTSSVCRHEDHECARVRRSRNRSYPPRRRDSAMPALGGAETRNKEGKAGGEREREREEEVARTGASDLTSTDRQ